MPLISVNNLKKEYSLRVLFENVFFDLEENEKVGLIGKNGTGKTTLFKLITGELEAEEGNIAKSKLLNISVVEQHLNCDEKNTVFDEALTVFEHLMNLEWELEEINEKIHNSKGNIDSLIEKQHTLYEKFHNEDGLVYKNRTRSTLLGLGFLENELYQRVGTLSGGQKSKLMLCKMLLSSANLLLLDEPTNHLDIPSVEWLEGFLKSYNGAMIVISHDRYFLDQITNKTLEIENSKIISYKGNYSAHLVKKEQDKLTLERNYQNTKKEIERIEGIIEQQHRWNRERNIKTAESKQKIVDKLNKTLEKPPEKEENIKFKFSSKQNSGNEALKVSELSMSFSNKVLFSGANLFIKKRERVFLLGENGSGKTTLFKIFLDEQKATYGNFKFGVNIETGYYSQTGENLNLNKSVLDEVWDSYSKLSETDIRNSLATFLFKDDDVFKQISTLSGGERAKISLLKLMLSKANFLILDEPTNHLDIVSREVLEDALMGYDGTLFIISHDRYFINKMANKIYYLNNKKIKEYAGNYDYFLEKKEKPIQELKMIAPKNEDYLQKKEIEAQRKKLTSKITKNEQLIEKTEQEIKELEVFLNSDEIASNYIKTIETTEQIEKKKRELHELLEEWGSLLIDN